MGHEKYPCHQRKDFMIEGDPHQGFVISIVPLFFLHFSFVLWCHLAGDDS
jgi:hypothetical protein